MSSKPAERTHPVVVGLHASGSSSRQWAPLADQLGAGYHVVAPNLHGHGAGPAWLGAPTEIVEADVARVAGIVTSERAVHLVGHSYGAVIALKLALAHPERVRSVTVWEPVMFRALRDYAPRSREAIEVAWIGRAVQRDLRSGLHAVAARRFVDYWSGAGTFADMPGPRREAIAQRMPSIAAHFAALSDDRMRIGDVAGSRMPLTVLMGARTRPATRRIVELLRLARPDATVAAMTAMGHMGPLTHPATVAQRLAAEVTLREAHVEAAVAALAA
jgi:pimeloyl-ACP methyl ester carboxylesterase